MKMRFFALISLLIFSYYLVYATYNGILHPIPAPGDSWDYHIPISQSILSGSFLYIPHARLPQWYYPGSSDAINAIFLLFHIPLTLSNIFAVLILFFVCVKLGLLFRLQYYFAVFFAAAVCTQNVFVRWYNAVSSDVWVAVFFLLGVILLERPQKSIFYFGKLGFVLGMLLGSKYMAIIYFILLMIFYWKPFFQRINLSRFVSFSLPFSLFGLFWYVRNYFLFHNPFYPLSVFFFNGPYAFPDKIWMETIKTPIIMFNAMFGEYNIWLFLITAVSVFYFYNVIRTKKFHDNSINRIFILGCINFILYFFYPTSQQPWIMVSSLRYSYPAFIPLFLFVFLLAQQYKKEHFVGFVALGTMLMVLPMAFYPKLTIIYFPLAYLLFYMFEKYKHFFVTI